SLWIRCRVDLKFHRLADRQVFKLPILDRAVVEKHVFPLLRRNESEPFLLHQLLDLTHGHRSHSFTHIHIRVARSTRVWHAYWLPLGSEIRVAAWPCLNSFRTLNNKW